ncbi:MAG: copper resistance protein CopC [Proteobacteria bacterium]|nr:copper resistance protein CopC [Pseudomonadota bacterium]TDJ32857.1 MAG: hypothetical protein E2O53_11365 [Gammaproteobacteria bacterium]
MNRSIPLLFIVAVMLSGWAYSHAKMTSTIPADGDTVCAPEILVLTFDNAVQLTGVQLSTVEGDNRDLGDFSAERAKTFTISVPNTLPPGEYYVVWRSIAADSHFSTGEFFFTVVTEVK